MGIRVIRKSMAKQFHAEVSGNNLIKSNNCFSASSKNNVLTEMKVFLGRSLVLRWILTLQVGCAGPSERPSHFPGMLHTETARSQFRHVAFLLDLAPSSLEKIIQQWILNKENCHLCYIDDWTRSVWSFFQL